LKEIFQEIHLDLSEGKIVACNGVFNCYGGGNSDVALEYVENSGVVNQSCFPNQHCSYTCSNKCTNPSERICIGGRTRFLLQNYSDPETELKKRLYPMVYLPDVFKIGVIK